MLFSSKQKNGYFAIISNTFFIRTLEYTVDRSKNEAGAVFVRPDSDDPTLVPDDSLGDIFIEIHFPHGMLPKVK